MVNAFEITTAARIVFGAGKLAEVPGAVRAFGATRALLVRGNSPARARRLTELLAQAGVAVASTVAVPGEPTVELVRAATRSAIEAACDVVIAIGGGSALDAGKAIAVLATNEGDPLDYLEVIGRGRPLEKPSLPCVAIPTTAGTGSEVTRNAVLASHAERVKASLRSVHMLPRLAVVDPDLLDSAPPEVLASSGLDALSQLIEPFLSIRANPWTDGLAREGMKRSARSLRDAVRCGLDVQRREDLALASLHGGLCLANAGLGAVHGFAAPVGGMFDAPHGAVCAALLPAVMDVNLRALSARAPGSPVIERFREVAVLLLGRSDVRAEDGILHLAALTRELGVRGLSRYGLSRADVPALIDKASVASSMKANPIALSRDELTEIAERSL